MAVERVGIEIEIMGYQEAMNQLRALDKIISRLKNKRIEIGGLNRFMDRLSRSSAEMERMRKAMSELGAQMGNMGKAASGMSKVAQETAKANAQAKQLKKNLTIGEMFKQNTSRVAHLGSAMQSAGNAIQRFLAPWRLLVGGAALGAGFGAINKVSEGLTSGFARYDIMNKYPKMMKQFETANFTAQDSINKLDQSVRGLPTGLDEMVQMAQSFTMTMGDMQKGTDLAIATNNAFLASMANDTQRYQGMMQLRDLIGGKDMNAREWQALANSMMPAIRMMGEEMGKSGEELNEWVAAVQQGKVSNEEFLDALLKAGTGAGKAAKMAELSKDTWEALSANITNAFSRMGAGIITAMDEVTKIATGGEYEKLNRFLADKLGPGIDKAAKAVQNWIKANPDKIMDFFNAMKGIDWKGLGKGFVEGLGQIANFMQKVGNKLDGKSLEKFGKAFSHLLWLAPGLTIGGGLLKGGRHIFGGFLTGLQVLANGLGAIKLTGASKKLSSFVGFFKNLGKVSKAAEAAGAAGTAAGAAGGAAAAGGIFKAFLPAIEVIGGIGAITTEITGIAAIDTGLISLATSNIEKITGTMQKVFDNVKGLKSTGFNKENLRTAVNDMFSIYDIIYGEKTGQTGARGLTKGAAATQRKDGLGSMNKGALSKIATSMKSMSSIFGSMQKIAAGAKKFSGFKGFDESTMQGIKDFVSGIGDIYTDLNTSFEESGMDADKATGFADVIAKTTGMFNNIASVAKLIPTLQKQLAPLMQRGVGTGGMGYNAIETIRNTLAGEGGLFATIGDIMNAVYTDMLGNNGEGVGMNIGQVGAISTAMDGVKSMFTSISEIVTLLPQIQEQLAPLTQFGGGGRGNASALTALKDNLVGLFQRIGEVYTAFDTYIGEGGADMSEKFSGVVDAVTQIQSVVTKLNSLGEGSLASTDGAAFTAIQNIKTMIAQLGQALQTDTIAQLQAQVDAFKTAVQGIFDALNGDLANVEVTVTINGHVEGHDALIADIHAANSAIRSAVQSITNSYTRHVYVHIQRHVSVTGDNPASANVFSHTGGQIGRGGRLLYRSRGGGTIFRPRGTDTVPAMLTPGEYVHRKAAVDFFGVRFMQKINNLDIAGAMRELSAKAGRRSSAASGTTIYNNITHNNSPTINQNISTSNRNFAYKRAGRFVGALQ